MAIYGYCVVPRGHMPAAELTGIAASAVRAFEIGDLVVWVSDIQRPDPTIPNVQAHNAVVEGAISEDVTPVPLRFGQWAEDAGVFRSVVTDRSDWYAERLEAFAGALEFGIRVAAPERTESARVVRDPRAVTGTEYMNALRASVSAAQGQRAEEERVRAGVAGVMGDLVRDERSEEPRTPHGVVTISHLVPRAHFNEYRNRAATLREKFPELRFLVSGPWVPYTFAQ